MEEPEYLSDDEEEINEDYELPAPDEENNLDAMDLSVNTTKGPLFTGEEDFETAIKDIKGLAHEEFFQNGSREKVHSMDVLGQYVQFLKLIYDAIAYIFSTKTPIRMFSADVGDKLKLGLQLFFDVVLSQSKLPLNGQQAAYRNKLVVDYFITYPNCHRRECLSMD